MRLERIIGLTACLLTVWMGLSVQTSHAQGPQASADEVALVDALDRFSNLTGTNVVYAGRLVEGLTTSCAFVGLDAQQGINCILEGSGLQARWTRLDQVVIYRGQANSAFRVSGQVLDDETDEPLPGVHVLMEDGQAAAVSDNEGRFSVVVAGRASAILRFSHLGYEPVERDFVEGDADGVVRLAAHAIEGSAVVVEDSRRTTDDALSREVGADADHVNARALLVGSVDPALGAAAMPGISRTGEISGQFVVRGGLPDQNVFKMDGAPVYQPWHSQGLFSVLQPSTVQAMKLFTGPLPADEGGYLASVLDAEIGAGSRQPKAVAAVSSTVGEVALSGPIANGVTAIVAGRHSHIGLNRTHELSLPSNQRIDGGSFYDLLAKVGVRSSNTNQFSFLAYRGYDNLNWMGSNAARANGLNDEWSNGVYSFRHRYVPNRNLMVTNTFYVSSFDAVTTGYQTRSGLGAEDSRHVRDAGMKIDVDYRVAEGHQMKTGIEFTQHHLEWSDTRGSDYYNDNVMEGALFAHDTWTISNRLAVRPGMRVSWFGNGVGARVEPRFHALFHLSQSTSLHGSWARQVQYLHQISDVSAGGLSSTVQRWHVASDQNVRPSTGDQFNMGVSAQAGRRWTLGADVYWRDFNDVFLPRDRYAAKQMLSASSYNQTSGLSDFEQGGVRAYGLELSASYRKDWFLFSSSYHGSRSLYQISTPLQSSSYRPGVYDAPHVLRASTGYSTSGLSAVISAEARTGYPTLAAVRGTGRSLGSERLPTYFRLDASIGYAFASGGLDWNIQARVYNLTDRENVVGYEYDQEFLYLSRSSLLGITRWPTLKIQVGF